MYLNPFRDFLKRILSGGRIRRRVRFSTGSRSRRLYDRGTGSFATAVEVCEARTLLSGPQLVQVVPNVGTTINLAGTPANATVENQAPTQLVLTFSAGSAINAASAQNAFTVTRAGGDATFGNGNDVAVPVGSVQVDPTNPNQVIVRFQDTLVNDVYQVQVAGTLSSSTGLFNGGQAQKFDFSVDFGSQVVSVVPQPVLRPATLSVVGTGAANVNQVTNGDTFTISAGRAPVTFQFQKIGQPLILKPGNVGILYNATDSAGTIAGDIATAINSQATSGKPLNGLLQPATAVGSSVQLNGTAYSPVVSVVSAVPASLSAVGVRTTLLGIDTAPKLTDGDTFSVFVTGLTQPVVFQFTHSSPLGSSNGVPNTPISYNVGDSAFTLSNEIAAAIN